jgi:ubiquinone/menaquinone biosynthesis C-methylase UbiE
MGSQYGQEKANYGFVAWRFFAYMGLLGVLGLVILLVRSNSSELINSASLVVGGLLAFVGFYIGGSYLYLYPAIFKPRAGFNPMGDMIRETGLRGDERVLDVGCGTGRVSIQIAKMLNNSRVTGIDIFEGVSGSTPDIPRRNAEIEGVADRVEFRHGNALDLPFEDDSFDIVTMGSVLHEIHSVDEKITAIREIMRVLRPGGRFVTFELIRTWKMYVTLLFFAHVWKSLKYWEELFGEVGTEVQKIEITKSILDMAVFVVVEGSPPAVNGS